MSAPWWKSLPLPAREEWLRSAAASKELGKKTASAALDAVRRKRRDIRSIACSSTWVDDCENGTKYPMQADSRNCDMVQAKHGGSGAATSGCFNGEQLVRWPAYYVDQAGRTYEWQVYRFEVVYRGRLARETDGLPEADGSPSSEAIQSLGLMLIDGKPVKLADSVPGLLAVDDESSLLDEIRYFEETGVVPEPLPVNCKRRRAALLRRRRRLESRQAKARGSDLRPAA